MTIKTGVIMLLRVINRGFTTRPSAAGRHFAGVLAVFLSVWAGGILLTGCESTDSFYNVPKAPVHSKAGAPDYSTNLLEQGDVVSITFRYSTNYNTEQRIGLDGTLNLDVAGQVKAADKTILELQDELTKLYQSQIKDDPITVKVVTPAAAVYVTGAVNRPGKVSLERPMTVLEAIMEAGGADPVQANLADVLVLRVENNRQHTYKVNLKRVLDGKDDTVFYLKPFDVVRVPAKIFNY